MHHPTRAPAPQHLTAPDTTVSLAQVIARWHDAYPLRPDMGISCNCWDVPCTCVRASKAVAK